MHIVAVLALPDVVAVELSIPGQVFESANTTRRRYDVRVCGDPAGTTATAHGAEAFRVIPPYPLEEAVRADTVIVPASETAIDQPPEVLDVLRRAHARGARIASICAGAYVLAAAGLLDGRPATTHWSQAARLASLHPLVKVDPDVLFVDDGDILTAAGVAAGFDLCLHMVGRDHGAAVAAAAARLVVMPPRRDGGQAQYIRHEPPTGDLGLEPTMRWMVDHLDRTLTLAEIARHAATSDRTLSRRFRAEVGATPIQWLTTQRVHRAQELLETTDLPVEEVARRTGFGTAINLRQHFARTVGTSPTTYRRTFTPGG